VVSNWEALPVVLDLFTVSLIFNVSETTIKNWLKNGQLKGRKIGHLWFFDKTYIQSLFD
jgi:hypothetical protein